MSKCLNTPAAKGLIRLKPHVCNVPLLVYADAHFNADFVIISTRPVHGALL
jgi:hypothetical protein